VPKADIKCAAANCSLFDHLVGSYDQVLWDCETERLGGLPIDDEIEFRRPLDRQVRWLSPLEDLVDKKRASIPEIRKILIRSPRRPAREVMVVT